MLRSNKTKEYIFMDTLILTVCSGIAGFLKCYIVALTLRVYLTWFPNINFFAQPFSTLGKIADPYLKVFRGIVPPLLGFDLSPLLCFVLLTFLIDIFSNLSVG
jgi:YggT family protein